MKDIFPDIFPVCTFGFRSSAELSEEEQRRSEGRYANSGKIAPDIKLLNFSTWNMKKPSISRMMLVFMQIPVKEKRSFVSWLREGKKGWLLDKGRQSSQNSCFTYQVFLQFQNY